MTRLCRARAGSAAGPRFLALGEYRLSNDIDFLCADADGYRKLRSLVVYRSLAGLFGGAVGEARAFKGDQYGSRGIIVVDALPIRVEIGRKGRIPLEGQADSGLGVPRLIAADPVAEKLLANADRCQDRSTAYRDAIDLGMIALRSGPFPAAALAKAELAYGADVVSKVKWVLHRLAGRQERLHASTALGMDAALVDAAVASLSRAAPRLREDVTGYGPGAR